MAQNINDNLRLHAPKLLDDRAGPYASVAAALAGIPAYQRVEGLEVIIEVGGVQKKYWFDGGIADVDLVEIPSGGSGGYDPKNSIEVDAGELQLVGDEASPGNSKYYGTDGAGAKGFHDLPGADGVNAYVYIAYASDDSGTGFTMTFDPLLDYIAIKSTTVEIATPQATDFTGLWKNYKGVAGAPGTPGEDGLPGTDGTDGASAFVYIAYASDDIGTGFTLTFDPALNYIAIKATTTEIVSPVAADFDGLWKNYKGADGSGGGTSTPKYYPIPVFAYLDGKVIQTKRDIGGGKFIESRVAYHASGDNVGKANFIEIKDERTDPAIWVRETINYTNKVLTSTTVADIVAWTITI